MAYNLLTDPLIRTTVRDGITEVLSIPEVFEVLVADQVVGFPALRAHQRHGWHAFLAQLGAMVLHANRVGGLPTGADEWRFLIRTLSNGHGDDPWTLVVEDFSRPAFLQCPDAGNEQDYKTDVQTPDGLDILVTSKNHDEKQDQAFDASPDDWIFVLVTLQTMAGFSGRGNYGIARMNGGQSSRWCFGLSPLNVGPGGHLVHDISSMLKHQERIVKVYPEYYVAYGGASLLWLDPWDGRASRPLRHLDPYFIEFCRRIRLKEGLGRIWAKKAPSMKSRIQAKAAKGNVADFWTPVHRKKGVALTASRRTVQYDKLAEILFNPTAYDLPPALKQPIRTAEQMQIVVRGWVGGQGKTEGYFERGDLIFGKKVLMSFMHDNDRDRLAELVQEQLAEVSSIAKALRYAIAVMANGGREENLKPSHWDSSNSWSRKFDRLVDDIFFQSLDRRFQHEGDDAETFRALFGRELIKYARDIFSKASESTARSSSARHRAVAVGELALRRKIRNGTFGDLLKEI